MKIKLPKIMFVIILLSLSALACNALSGGNNNNTTASNNTGSEAASDNSGSDADSGDSNSNVQFIADMPVPGDAFETVDTTAFGIVAIVYKTNLSIEEVADFYKEEMPKAGFELTTESITSDGAALVFDNSRISLAIGPDTTSDATIVTLGATP